MQLQLKRKYHHYNISNIVRLKNPSGTTIFKLEARKENENNGTVKLHKHYLTYDSGGNLLSRTKEKEIYYTGAPSKPNHSSGDSGGGHKH